MAVSNNYRMQELTKACAFLNITRRPRLKRYSFALFDRLQQSPLCQPTWCSIRLWRFSSRVSDRMAPLWYLTKDGDETCLALYLRHYSSSKRPKGKRIAQFVGPGEHIVLRTGDGDAMFVWRKFIDDSGQRGINCAVFRNEAPKRYRSSELIRQADAIADFCWPGERHYTYVNQEAVRSRNPGFCFVAAGWRRCGFTKGRLLILERMPPQ